MQVNVPVNLRIVPKVKGKSSKKIIAGIEQFMYAVPFIFQEFKKRTLKAALAIAPVRTGGLRNSIQSKDLGEMGIGLSVAPKEYNEKLFGKNITKSVKIKTHKWVKLKTHKRKDIYAGSPVRGIMQEFGYPYSSPVFLGPYKPNPKGPKIKNLGYLRVSYIVAARSLNASSISYSNTRLDRSAVAAYGDSTQNEFSMAVKKILSNYLKNGSLPGYLRKKSVQKVSNKVNLGSVKMYGQIEGLKLTIPISITNTPEYDSTRVGDNLRNATQSLNGKHFSEGHSFLTDNTSFDISL